MTEHQNSCSCNIYKLNKQVGAVSWELAGHIPLERYSSIAVTKQSDYYRRMNEQERDYQHYIDWLT